MKRLIRNLRDYLIIWKSKIFSANFYENKYPDVQASKRNPLWHYIRFGVLEGRDPSEFFVTDYYLWKYPDVEVERINPLAHFLLFGIHEKRSPHYLISSLDNDHPVYIYYFANKSAILSTLFNKPVKINIKQFVNELNKNKIYQSNSLRLYQPHNPRDSSTENEFVNWDRKPVKIIQSVEKLWVVKIPLSCEDLQREILLYSLGKDFVNVAETRHINFDELKELIEMGLLPEDTQPSSAILIRLAQDYLTEELPLKDIDSAMAGEFVFSLWVRRRDATRWNRAYNSQRIPVFFDYHASLNYNSCLQDCDAFFSRCMPGYPGTWRVVEKEINQINITTARKAGIGINFITDKKAFLQGVEEIVKKITGHNKSFISLIEEAGFPPKKVSEINEFLVWSQVNLPNDIPRMLDVIFSSN